MTVPGSFITFEGGDGSGKSTQAELLEAWLQDAGHTVVRTREPGGTPLGDELREIVLHSEGNIAPRAEALIFAASRAQHVAEKVRPALARGEIVIMDRYLDSSVAYQGVARGLGADAVRDISLWATEDLLPDLTIVLDLDETASRERLDDSRTRYDRLEAEERDFHERVRAAYLQLANAEPLRFIVVDASLPVDEIAAAIRTRVSTLLD